MQEEAPTLYHAACEFFGTWEIAMEYAGIDVRRISILRRTGPRKELIQQIQKLSDDDLCATAKEIRLRNRYIYYASIEHFGSWGKALQAAGITRIIGLSTQRQPETPSDSVNED